MPYSSAVSRLYRLAAELYVRPGEPRRKFELDQMRVLMKQLGDPQKTYPSVLIAGTNGKGSTASTLSSILAAAGYKVGLYTSPHLVRVNERIQLLQSNAQSSAETTVARHDIEDPVFSDTFEQVEAAAHACVRDGRLPADPSFFEAMTAMAFCYFAAEKVDIAVLEVGMGGRLDATNIVDPLLSIITDISLDHTEWLGPTVAAITREKAGILRAGVTMVTLPQHPEANQVLGEIAVPMGVKGVNAADFIPSRQAEAETDGNRNRYRREWAGTPLSVETPLAGQHQQRNIALALAAALELRTYHGYNIGLDAAAAGVRQTQWPGRLESYPATEARPRIVLDVGHNPAGAWALRMALSHLAEEASSRTLIFSCLNDKPADELAQILFPLFDRVILTPVDSPRSSTLTQLSAAAQPTGTTIEECASPYDALDLANRLTPHDGLIVATGSVLLVGAVRSTLELVDELSLQESHGAAQPA
jgi:dihydrofolate synthase/folylpolyglutamate synthase